MNEPMSAGAERYWGLLRALGRLWAEGLGESDRADAVRADMDVAWCQLTDADVADLLRRLRETRPGEASP